MRRKYGLWISAIGPLILMIYLVLAPSGGANVRAQTNDQENPAALARISTPGHYQGYSQPIYSEWVRTSQYVPVRDGTRLAVDIIRPSRDGQPVSEPLPVIWTFTPYRRSFHLPGGKLVTVLDQMTWLQTVLKHGYVIAAADIGGTGASFGSIKGNFTPGEASDAYDITEWLAAQPWSTGKVGMCGVSYQGIMQYLAASTAPPHLVAVIPDMAMFDLYAFTYPGGIYQDDFINDWSNLVMMLSTSMPAAPVDDDPGSKLLTQALHEHQKNNYPVISIKDAQYRDSLDPVTHVRTFLNWSPNAYLKGIQDGGFKIAVYHVAGWFDLWPRDALTWFNNLSNPQKIILTPWSHSHDQAKGWKADLEMLCGFLPQFDYVAEQLRWFDYWLKDIDNGIMSEPPVYYFTIGASMDDAWEFAQQWPLPESKPARFYFQAGPSKSIRSPNDGLLTQTPPQRDPGQDEYAVDYTTSTGKTTRWHNGRGGGFGYPDMASNDTKALTYTTAPLKTAITVTGHPIVHLWLTSSAVDGDFFAYLEEVDGTGYSHYLTEGKLRASHRKLSTPSYNFMNLPYHRSFKEDFEPLPPGQPVELVFDLLPTSNVFDAGHRIRLTIACADQTSFETPEISPQPRVSVYRNIRFSSFIELPIIPKPGKAEEIKGIVLSTTLILIAIIVLVVVLVLFLRARLKK
jgi:putative CocE/NonD family hydrolase